MTARGMSASMLAQVGAQRNRPLHLFALYLDAGTVYATDAYRPIVWGGDTYLANGHFLTFSGLEESVDLSVTQASVAISGVEQTFVAVALAHDYIDRRITIRKAFLDPSSEAVIVDPCLIFDGRVDGMTLDEDPDAGTSLIALSASSHWSDFERRPGRHTNNADQQLYFPGDLGFEYAAQNVSAVWGG